MKKANQQSSCKRRCIPISVCLALLLLLTAQTACLAAQLLLLALDPLQQGGQLVIGLLEQRLIEVQLIERADDLAGDAGGEREAEQQRRQQDKQNGGQQAEHQPPDAVLLTGEAQDAAVGQAAGIVEQLLHQGGGVAHALAVAVLHGGDDLFPLEVVFHVVTVALAVVDHGAVGGNPGDAAAAQLQSVKIFHPLMGDGLGGKETFHLELAQLGAGEGVVQRADQAGEGHQADEEGGAEDGAENAFCHPLSSPFGSSPGAKR